MLRWLGLSVLVAVVAVLAWVVYENSDHSIEFGVKFDERSIKEIFRVSQNKTSLSAFYAQNLSRADIIQAFHVATVPPDRALNGEYMAMMPAIPNDGIQNLVTNITHNYFGQGSWIAIAFKSYLNDTGEGYQSFLDSDLVTYRSNRFSYSFGPSWLDGKPALICQYYGNNSFPVNIMRDEIRRINRTFFVGVRLFELAGSIMPSIFFVAGVPVTWTDPWKPPTSFAATQGKAPPKKKKRFHSR